MLRPAPRRWLMYGMSILLGVMGAGLVSGVASAEDEGGSASLRAQLDEATRGYVQASAKLEASKARQEQLTTQLSDVQGRFASESAAVAAIAASAYRSAGLTTSKAGVFASGSPEGFLDRLTLLNAVATHEDSIVRTLANTRNEIDTAKTAIDAEVAQQSEQVAAMQARKQQAERALWAVGAGQASSGLSASSSIVAEAAPRNADGSWPGESCSVYEPVTGGCITPRTAHAKDQAQIAGFSHYVSCYRPVQDGGEHPKGRACDLAAAAGGFAGAAVGEERNYGNNLAAFFLFNANRLGVLYVIWYRQIWLPGSGWRTYSGGGSPSSEHTNHVHLSML